MSKHYGEKVRTVRADDALWGQFGTAVKAQGIGRSEVVRAFIAWYLRRPGAKLPTRPTLPPEGPGPVPRG